MLERLRDSSRSFGSYLIFGVIILVFVIYFGPGGQSCGDIGNMQAATWAAKVNGKEISVRDFRMEYDALYRQYQAQMGENFDPQLAQQMGIRTSAIDRLVTRRLLIDHAKAQGIAITDAELAEALQAEPAFQKDGHFDFDTYREVLRNWQGISPARYEAELRDNLLVGKVISQLRLSAKVADDEIRSAFESEADRAALAFVRIAPQDLEAEIEVPAETIAAFIASEEGAKQLADEYEAKAFRYKTPKRVRAQHILVKVDTDAPEEEAEAARAKILAAKEEIEGGADFGEVAKRVSEDEGSKENGGDLGLFGPGSMVKPFEDAAMAMEPGELSEPVRSRFGFHLIKVNEVQPASERSLDEVREELARELLAADVAKKEAQARAEALLAQAKDANLATLVPSAEEAGADAKGPTLQESPSFQVAGEFVPRLGVAPDLVRDAAALEQPALLPKVYEVAGSFVVAQVTERSRPDLSQLTDTKKRELEERLLLRKQNETIEAFIDGLKDGVDVETNEMLISAGF